MMASVQEVDRRTGRHVDRQEEADRQAGNQLNKKAIS